MNLWKRFLRILSPGLRTGDSWEQPDGSTLTYLGKVPDPWIARECQVCKGPATRFKTTPPWPGSAYSHTTMTCDAHESYLHGKSWGRDYGGEYYESESTSSCGTCHGPYGECEHTAGYAAMLAAQEAGAIYGNVLRGE